MCYSIIRLAELMSSPNIFLKSAVQKRGNPGPRLDWKPSPHIPLFIWMHWK